MWFVYVLLCEDNSFYTGSTNDIKQRFKAHQDGKGGRYTRSHKPIKIVYEEKLEDKSTALKRELEIKSWTRSQKINRLELHL